MELDQTEICFDHMTFKFIIHMGSYLLSTKLISPRETSDKIKKEELKPLETSGELTLGRNVLEGYMPNS